MEKSSLHVRHAEEKFYVNPSVNEDVVSVYDVHIHVSFQLAN